MGVPGFAGDGGAALNAKLNLPAARRWTPPAICTCTDAGNQRVRKIGLDGVITTVAGNGGCCLFGRYGPATAAQLGDPEGVAVDALRSIVHTQYLWPARAKRSIHRVPSPPSPGTAHLDILATGGKRRARTELAVIAVDAAGNVYIADSNNNVIRKVSPDGILSQPPQPTSLGPMASRQTPRETCT